MKMKPIRSNADLELARDTLERLLVGDRSTDTDDDIEILASLIDHFERNSLRIDAPTPVSAIKFRMEELGMNPRQLEPFIGTRSRVHEILSGSRTLSLDMIRSLHNGLGIPYSSLIEERVRPQSDELRVSSIAMERLRDQGFHLKAEELPLFVQSSFKTQMPIALHKKTLTQRAASKTDVDALTVWHAAVVNRALKAGRGRPFDPGKLDYAFMRQIARMSSQPNGCQRAVNSIHALGIVVVFLGALPGTFLDGAATITPEDRPVIALTLRHDRTDSFWFTLLHELAHIHLHFDRLRQDISAFVDDLETRADDELEKQADDLARECLIPSEILRGIHWNDETTSADLQSLASRARVHLSVAAGRWQRDHNNYRRFSRLIDRDELRLLFRVS